MQALNECLKGCINVGNFVSPSRQVYGSTSGKTGPLILGRGLGSIHGALQTLLRYLKENPRRSSRIKKSSFIA